MIQYRMHKWLNVKDLTPVYGVQAKRPGGKWLHASFGDKACLFTTEDEALMYLDLLELSDAECPA